MKIMIFEIQLKKINIEFYENIIFKIILNKNNWNYITIINLETAFKYKILKSYK